MDFTALRYFSETANSLSIRAASERLHVSPSAISRQIAKLEHELRTAVFDRRPTGMTLTPAGEILQAKVGEMLREFQRVTSHIAALNDLQAGTVDVFCFQTAIETFLAPTLHAFHARHPRVQFNISVSSTDATIEALAKSTIEIGLVVNPPIRDHVASSELFRDRIVAVVAPDDPLAKRSSVALRDLDGRPIVLTEKSFGLRQQVDAVYDRHGLGTSDFCVTNSLGLAKSIARHPGHCTLLPSYAVEQEVGSGFLSVVTIEEFSDEPMIFCICVRVGRTLSPAAKAFLDAIVDFCRRYR